MKLLSSSTFALLGLCYVISDAEAYWTKVSAGTALTDARSLAVSANGLAAGSPGNELFRSIQPTVIETVYVDNQLGSDTYDGSSPSPSGGTVGPKRTIAGAIAVATDGQTVSVARTGTGYDDLNTGAKSLRFTSTVGSPTISNITIAAATTFDGSFTLASPGTLTLYTGVLTGAHNLTISEGGTIVCSGGSFSPGDPPIVSGYKLVYQMAGSITSTSEEFVPSPTAVASLTIAGSGTLLTLHADRVIGSLVLNSPGGGIVLGSSTATTTLSIPGNVTISAGSISAKMLIAGVDKSPTVAFIGTSPQTITVPSGGFTLPNGIDSNNDGDYLDAGDTPPIDIEIDNLASSDTDRTVTLSGGNITMGWRGGTVWLKSGYVVTGSYLWTLTQGRNSATVQPAQGFSRPSTTGTSSHFVGNVCKYLDSTDPLGIPKAIFPVGTPPSPRACYRPLSIDFQGSPSAPFNLTVSHVNSRPSGVWGFPIVEGGITITDYADFNWYVRSDISLAPSIKYSMEIQAQGYTDYVVDQIENVRLIRRDPSDANPQWVLVKGLDGVLYENSTIAADWPVVKSIYCNGGITTLGTLFTYSKSNRTPFVATTAASNLSTTSATLNGQTFAIGLTLTVWFEWGTSSSLSTYSATPSQSRAAGTYASPVNESLAGLSPSTTYFYRLAGKDTGEVQRGSILSFKTTAAPVPSVPTLLSPADTARNVSLTPTLSWNPLDGAISYELQVSEFFNFSTCVYDDSTSGLSRTVGPLNLASTYYWRVRATKSDGISPFSAVRAFKTIVAAAIDQLNDEVPTGYALNQNYPNPFNPATTIRFAVPARGYVSLKVFDPLGREVKTLVSQELGPGSFSVQWLANVTSGIYFYRLQVVEFAETKKMILLR